MSSSNCRPFVDKITTVWSFVCLGAVCRKIHDDYDCMFNELHLQYWNDSTSVEKPDGDKIRGCLQRWNICNSCCRRCSVKTAPCKTCCLHFGSYNGMGWVHNKIYCFSPCVSQAIVCTNWKVLARKQLTRQDKNNKTRTLLVSRVQSNSASSLMTDHSLIQSSHWQCCLNLDQLCSQWCT